MRRGPDDELGSEPGGAVECGDLSFSCNDASTHPWPEFLPVLGHFFLLLSNLKHPKACRTCETNRIIYRWQLRQFLIKDTLAYTIAVEDVL